MQLSQSYVLIFDQESEDLIKLRSLLERLRFPVVVACSTDQVVASVSQSAPCLVILAGSHQNWSGNLVNHLRGITNASKVTIVALTDIHAPRWSHQEENPGLDGFLVKPLSGDVLTSLVQSAWARQVCSSVS